jgi:hypothetical protein
VPGPIKFVVRGSTNKMEKFLKSVQKLDIGALIANQAQLGAEALANATPKDSGLASHTWGYEVSQNGGGVRITWTNSDIESGFPVAIMLQYGYATGTGGYVQGRDYINPAIRPVFDQIANTVWKAVTSA